MPVLMIIWTLTMGTADRFTPVAVAQTVTPTDAATCEAVRTDIKTKPLTSSKYQNLIVVVRCVPISAK
jgi:hypothetical protein